MLITIPFRNKEDATDVQIVITNKKNKSLTEEEKNRLNVLSELFTQCIIEYNGKFNTNFVSIWKEQNCLCIKINDEMIKK